MTSECEVARRVLLVDDSAVSRRGAQELLATLKPPPEVVCCSSAEDVLGRFDELSGFDCAVVDRILPGMDGLSLVRRLRELGCELPVVVLTGTGSERIAAEALACGVEGYIIKEATRQQLRLLPLVVQRAIDRRLEKAARREAEERLRWRERELTTIMSSTPGVMSVLDESGRYLHVFTGTAELLPASTERLVGRLVSEVLPAESVQIMRVLSEVRRTGLQRSLEYKSRRGDRVYWFGAKLVSLPSMGGFRALWVENDITKRRRIEQEIRESREQFESLAAHERELRERTASHLSHSMHEGLAQTLTAVTMDLSMLRVRMQAAAPETLEVMDRCMTALNEAAREVVGLSHALRTPALDRLGLVAGLEWVLASVCRPPRMTWSLAGAERCPTLDRDCATQIYRLLEDWVRLHVGESSRGSCEVGFSEDEEHRLSVQVELRLDGGGSQEPSDLPRAAMTARARRMGGELVFEPLEGDESPPRMRLTVPMPVPAQPAAFGDTGQSGSTAG